MSNITGNRFYINIEDCPRLEYAIYLSNNFYRRIKSVEKTNGIVCTQHVPSLVSEYRRKLQVKRETTGMYDFYTEEDGMSGDIQDTFQGSLLVKSRREKCEDSLIQMELNCTEKNKLMTILENEILQYIKIKSKELKTFPECDKVTALIATGEAILNTCHNKSGPVAKSPIYKYIFHDLKSLQDEENVVGYGLTNDSLYVLVMENGCDETAKTDLFNKLNGVAIAMGKILAMSWLKEKPVIFGIQPGDACSSNSQQGSIGAFVRINRRELGFTTAAHVIKKNQIAFAESTRIGTCIANLKADEEDNERYRSDFAVVKVDEKMSKSCQLKRFPTSLDSCPGRVVFSSESTVDLTGKIVQKRGAVTGVTEGVVQLDNFLFKQEKECRKGFHLLIKSNDPKNPFAEKGDSGSAVFIMNFENSITTVEITSTFFASAKAENGRLFFAYRIDQALKQLEDEGMQLEPYIENEDVHSFQ